MTHETTWSKDGVWHWARCSCGWESDGYGSEAAARLLAEDHAAHPEDYIDWGKR